MKLSRNEEIATIIERYHWAKETLAPDLLREFRGERSYAKAAKELGVTRSYLWKIEKGLEMMSDELLIKLMEKE